MTLLNAPVFDERKEKLRKTLMVAVPVMIAVLTLITLVGFLLGHGWFFTNLPVEHKVDTFFNAIEAKDFNKAYAIYTNDPAWQQHADLHKDYPIDRFTVDWTSESPVHEPILSHHVDISKTDGTGTFGTGIIVAVRINGKKKLFMWYQKSDGTLTEPAPHEIQY